MSELLPHKISGLIVTLSWMTYLRLKMKMQTGYIVEFDLHAPVDLHAQLKEFPLARETLTLDIDWLSPYQKEIGVNTGIMHNEVFHGSNKLAPHGFDHTSYVIH